MSGSDENIFMRTSLLLGDDCMSLISSSRVIIFGVGGVGSWCAESLVRSGISHLTIVDSDVVCRSNLNRQLMATSKTIGMVKVEVLKDRLLEINPSADINAIQKVYSSETNDDFHLDDYDYIIDAIDSVSHKCELIERACETNGVLFSSMGAALKLDPSKIRVSEFRKVKGCPLARALRNKFKKLEHFPRKHFKVVYSDELLKNKGIVTGDEASSSMSDGWSQSKSRINGTIAHTVAIFGFTLAGLVIQDIVGKGLNEK